MAEEVKADYRDNSQVVAGRERTKWKSLRGTWTDSIGADSQHKERGVTVEMILAQVLSRVTDGVFSVDTQWNFDYMNESGARLVESTVEELVGRNFWQVFPEAVGSVFEENYRRSFEHQEIVVFEGFYGPLERWSSVHAYPSPEGLTVFFQDTTQRHLAEEEAQHALDEVHGALEGTLAALGQMTETRDPYTAGHQLRVGSLGAAIAAHYGLDIEMIKLIQQSGDVHDIGKITVPSEILTKPGRLSPLEFDMVKLHTTVGCDILTKASLPWPMAKVALQHHERLDGSGYPNGLLGDEIILPARIIAVADVVEAMTQHRPYRPALGLDKALAEVSAGAGTLFDADVVKSCIAVFKAGFTFANPSSSRASDPSKID